MSGFSPEYLAAKKMVDERCLAPRVWDRFQEEIRRGISPRTVLDLGAGNGAFFERLLRTEIENITYSPLDSDSSLLDAFLRGLNPKDLRSRGIRVEPIAAKIEDYLLEFHAGGKGRWGLVLSNAFLDLLDLEKTCDPLLSLVSRGGLFYFTMVFDGATNFLPGLDIGMDSEMETLYHASMNHNGRSGSRAGRTLFEKLSGSSSEILEAGPSDWVVFPGKNGYREGEEHLLRSILDFHEEGFRNSGNLQAAGSWLKTRREQLASGGLGLLTHQWDILGRMI